MGTKLHDCAECLHDSAHTGLHILIVEDYPDEARAMDLLLRLSGHDSRVVHDGPHALREFERDRPDVVLLDIGLPGMDGYEVASRMLAQGGRKKPCLIAITGYGMEQDRRFSAEAGIDLHLLKPADPATLLALLARLENIVLPADCLDE